ncbi:MAG TPA: SGNH/GDSL hydrolase family protein, partial [Ktedonobacterales bacterium]
MWRRFAPRTRPASPSSRRALGSPLPAILLVALLALAACDAPAGGGDSTAAHPPTPTATSAPAATATPHSAVRYVAIGASDAVGVGASNPNTSAYVPILISRLPKGSYALNLGIDGETLSRALNDELPQAIAAHPTLITVWLVGNDFKGCVPLQQYGVDLNTL